MGWGRCPVEVQTADVSTRSGLPGVGRQGAGGGLWRAEAADVSRDIFVCKRLAFKTPLVKQNTPGAESTPWPASSHITMRRGRARGWRKNGSRTHLSCPLPPRSSRQT